MTDELKPSHIEDDTHPSAEQIARLKAELARKIDAAEAEIRSHRSLEPESAMTDEELSRLLDEYATAVKNDEMNDGFMDTTTALNAARAAIHTHFDRHVADMRDAALRAMARATEADRRKSGEGGEDARDAARYRWLRDESANSVLGPFVMSAGPGMYGWIEGERTDALVDAARTEGKGNG